MSFGKRPHSKIHFGRTGKPNVSTKQVQRDEIGDLDISVKIDATGRTRIDFGKPVTYIALTADKAFDFAHLILEHVKDKQGGEPVNVTEEKIAAALSQSLVKLELVDPENSNDLAQRMLPYFMVAMAGEETEAQATERRSNMEAMLDEPADTTTPIGEAQL